MRILPALLLAALTAAPAAAQTPADTSDACAAPAEAYLEGRDVRARLLNNGSFFWNGDPYVYEVPRGSGENAIFATNLWIGGLVRDTLHITAETYGPYLFRGGPLDAAGRPPADCTPYNRLHELRRDDFSRPGGTANLADWPVHLGAPATADGRPALYGDHTVWWVMNDVAAPRDTTRAAVPYGAPPVGVEVRVTAFAFDVPGDFGRTTFYRLHVTYRGDAPLEDAYLGFYADDDLGNFGDDYTGADTTLHLAYTYNGDDHDDGHYGDAPPAIGYTFLKTPRGADGQPLGMTTVVPIVKGASRYAEPITPVEYYNNLRGRWANGEPVHVGGDGRPDHPDADPERTTTIGFPGDPTTGAFWSMTNIDGRGTAEYPSDKRHSFSTGPFSMQPGETEELWMAIVWARGTDHLDSVRELKHHTAYLHTIADALFEPTAVRPAAAATAPAPPLGFAPPFPNPAADRTTVRYSVPHAMPARLVLHDVLGREVAVLAGGTHAPGDHTAEIDVRGLAPGTYFVRLALYGTAFTRPLVVVR